MIQVSQLLKGILEGCIMALLQKEENYGYMIVEKLMDMGFVDIHEATVYPILTRLEKKKLLSSKKKPSSLGPPRKYYQLTDEGQVLLKLFVENWQSTGRIVNSILESEELI